MAVAFRNSATPTGNPTTSYTITIPSDTVAGDILILSNTNRDADTDPSVTDNDTGGNTWVKIGGSACLTVWWKRATSGTASKTITAGSQTGSCSGVLKTYSGARATGNPFENFATESNASADESQAAINATFPGSMLIVIVANDANDNSVTTFTATDPSTLSVVEKLSTGGSDCSNAQAHGAKTNGGTTGTLNWSQATNAATISAAFILAPPLDPGIATETDAALTPGVQEKLVTGVAAETDTALNAGGLTTGTTLTPGIAAETDSALSPGIVERIAVGVALETDTARAPNVTAVGIAAETDSALSPGIVERIVVGVAAETDTARAPNVTMVGIAVETDVALSPGIVERLAVGVAAETDTARAPNVTMVGIAVETDTAFAPTLTAGGINPGIAVETDVALAPGIVERLAVGRAAETDAALALGIVERLSVGVAAETDAALALTLSQRIAVGVALETDATLALAIVERIAVGRADEIDAALSPFGVGINSGVSLETDTAFALVLWQVAPRQGIDPWAAGEPIDPWRAGAPIDEWVAANFPGKWEPYEVD